MRQQFVVKHVLSVMNVQHQIHLHLLVVLVHLRRVSILLHVHDVNQVISHLKPVLFNVKFVHEVSIVHKWIQILSLVRMEPTVIINKLNVQHVHQAITP